MKKVVLIQRVVCDYRKEFFEQLYSSLLKDQIELTLLAGLPWKNEGHMDILNQLSFGVRLKNIRLFKNVYWEWGVLSACQGADLIIFEQANAALHIYPLLMRWMGKKTKVAFYGHGAHLNKTTPHPLRDHWRRFWSSKVDWWFAYTQLSADIVARDGFDLKKITVVENAIDTNKLRMTYEALSEMDLIQLSEQLFSELNKNSKTSVFCARLTELKWIPFLLDALLKIKEKIPEFRMIIIGEGAGQRQVEKFSSKNRWCVYLGAKHGVDRVKYLALGDIWLNPGASGLAILDAFALSLPFITTDCKLHGPEIAYLEDNENGLITPTITELFAHKTVNLLNDKNKLKRMKEKARNAGKNYTIENMVKNFSDGIKSALECYN